MNTAVSASVPGEFGHRALRRAILLFWAAVALLCLLTVIVAWAGWSAPGFYSWFSWFLFVFQDVFLIVMSCAISLLGVRYCGLNPNSNPIDRLPVLPTYVPIAAVLLLVCVCYAGHYLLLDNYALTRDEQLANFDMYIFSNGHLFWPIPLEWRRYVNALNTMFVWPVGHFHGWISGYLPVNAAMRAFFEFLGDPALTNPILTGVGMIALWRIVLMLWPKRPSALIVALLLYIGSGQIVFTGMTAFAMPGFLALNLVWLWLYLQDRRPADCVAIAIGFLATGFHQPLFHPLFSCPFLALVLFRRQWSRVFLFCVGYAFIAAFWIAWPIWITHLGTSSGPPGSSTNDLTRLSGLLQSPGIGALWLMSLNLLRFVAWQHVLLVPLIILGVKASWRTDPLARSLAISFILPIPVMLILLPWQGQGWGYRYMHGVLGNGILLAVYGFESINSDIGFRNRIFALASAASLFLLLPQQALMMHRYYAPAVALNDFINSSGADLAIIDDRGAPFSADLVLNRPDLSNRPVRLRASYLVPPDMTQLCRSGEKLLVVTDAKLASIRDFFGRSGPTTSPHLLKLTQAAERAGCVIVSR